MAHAEFDMRNISRSSKGKTQPRSVVAAAAYRAGVTLEDERYEKTHNYVRKQNILHEHFMAPQDAPEWARDRETLWNRVEADSSRKDARLAREALLILPRGLDEKQMVELVEGFVNENFVEKGMCADVAIHRGEARDGHEEGNPHAHVLLTCRGVSAQGWDQYSAGGKGPNDQPWYSKKQLCDWRKAFADKVNGYLEGSGQDYRATAFFHERREQDRKPEPRMGKAAGMESRGEASDRGREVRKVRHDNELRSVERAMRTRAQASQAPAASPARQRSYFVEQGLKAARVTATIARKAGEALLSKFDDLKERLQLKARLQSKPQQRERGNDHER